MFDFVGIPHTAKGISFQERMSNTAHQRETLDLMAAGLNPVLSAGGSGASTPSQNTPDTIIPLVSAVSKMSASSARSVERSSKAMSDAIKSVANLSSGVMNSLNSFDYLNAMSGVRSAVDNFMSGPDDFAHRTGTYYDIYGNPANEGKGLLGSINRTLQGVYDSVHDNLYTDDPKNRTDRTINAVFDSFEKVVSDLANGIRNSASGISRNKEKKAIIRENEQENKSIKQYRGSGKSVFNAWTSFR